MALDPALIDYVKAGLAQGKRKEEMYAELLAQGKTIELIQAAFVASTLQESKEDASRRTIRVILTVGAVLIGAGIFSFVAANWQYITRPAKVSIILTAMIAAYAVGWYMRERAGLRKTGEALMLLGAIIYGSGIFLVAQMFNIRANWPDGFILWMLGVVGLALAVESYSLYRLGIILGIVALVGHPFSLAISFRHDPFLLTSSFLLLAATLATFWLGLSMRTKAHPELKTFY